MKIELSFLATHKNITDKSPEGSAIRKQVLVRRDIDLPQLSFCPFSSGDWLEEMRIEKVCYMLDETSGLRVQLGMMAPLWAFENLTAVQEAYPAWRVHE